MDFYTELIHYFKEHAIERVFAKDELLLKEGQTESHLYWVESGAIRVFWLSEHEEVNIRFGYPGSIINSLASYLKQQPSEFYISALRKSTVKMLSRERLDAFIHQSVAHEQGYATFLEAAFAQQIDREIDLLTVSPADRLERVLKRSPNLFQEIPLKHIASYLRMTPETLSRIRKG